MPSVLLSLRRSSCASVESAAASSMRSFSERRSAAGECDDNASTSSAAAGCYNDHVGLGTLFIEERAIKDSSSPSRRAIFPWVSENPVQDRACFSPSSRRSSTGSGAGGAGGSESGSTAGMQSRHMGNRQECTGKRTLPGGAPVGSPRLSQVKPGEEHEMYAGRLMTAAVNPSDRFFAPAKGCSDLTKPCPYGALRNTSWEKDIAGKKYCSGTAAAGQDDSGDRAGAHPAVTAQLAHHTINPRGYRGTSGGIGPRQAPNVFGVPRKRRGKQAPSADHLNHDPNDPVEIPRPMRRPAPSRLEPGQDPIAHCPLRNDHSSGAVVDRLEGQLQKDFPRTQERIHGGIPVSVASSEAFSRTSSGRKVPHRLQQGSSTASGTHARKRGYRRRGEPPSPAGVIVGKPPTVTDRDKGPPTPLGRWVP